MHRIAAWEKNAQRHKDSKGRTEQVFVLKSTQTKRTTVPSVEHHHQTAYIRSMYNHHLPASEAVSGQVAMTLDASVFLLTY